MQNHTILIYYMILQAKNQKKIGNYQLIEVIGKGANGVVYRGLNNETGRSVAIKQVQLLPEQLKPIQSEIYLLRQLNHIHIVKYVDVLQSQNCLHIVLEFVEGGSLGNLVKKYPLPEQLTKVYIRQVLSGLDFLHQMGVVHRDIKGANILLNKEGIVKLADFGVAVRLNQDHKTFSLAGTPYWMAPQIIEGKTEVSTSCDIWSLGCTVIELLTGNPPYFDLMTYPAMFKIVQDDHPPLPEVSQECKDFLMQCFKKQPSERLTAKQLIKHHWLQTQSSGEESPLSLSINIKQLIQDRQYKELAKCVSKIPTKKLIYHNPKFIELAYQQQHQFDRAQFVTSFIKQDFQTLKYLSSIGMVQAVLENVMPKSDRLNTKISEMILEITSLCIKNTDVSLFTGCFKTIKKLYVVMPDHKNLTSILEMLTGEQIIVNSHLMYMFCKELILNNLVFSACKNIGDHNECSRILSIIVKISYIRQSQILQEFRPSIKAIMNLTESSDNQDHLLKLLRIIYNLSKDPLMADRLENEGVIPRMLAVFNKVARWSKTELTTQILLELLRVFQNMGHDQNRREQLIGHEMGQSIALCYSQGFKKQLQQQVTQLEKQVYWHA